MTIELAKDVETFLQEQVEAGVCASPSELVNDAIRSLRESQRKPFKVSRELEAWLLASAGKSTTPLTKRHFEAICKRLRARTGSASVTVCTGCSIHPVQPRPVQRLLACLPDTRSARRLGRP